MIWAAMFCWVVGCATVVVCFMVRAGLGHDVNTLVDELHEMKEGLEECSRLLEEERATTKRHAEVLTNQGEHIAILRKNQTSKALRG